VQLCAAIGFGASPALINACGWGWTFYLFGGAALLWVPFWLQMAREKGNQAVRTAAAAMLTMQRQQAERSAVMVSAATAAVRQGSNNIVSTAGLKLTRPGEQQAEGLSQKGPAQDQAAATVNHPLLMALEQQQQLDKQQVAAAASAAEPQQQQQQQQPNVGFWPLMRRKEVWAIAVAQYAAGWGFYGLLAWLPQFFIEHCGLQLSQLGGFTLAPYLLQAVMGASAGLLADNLIQKRKWGVRDVRVLMQVGSKCGLVKACLDSRLPSSCSMTVGCDWFRPVLMALVTCTELWFIASVGVRTVHLSYLGM
jgi:cyanate permease